MPEQYPSGGAAQGAAMEHNAAMAARHDRERATEEAACLRAELVQARAATPALTDDERDMLAFALDLAADEIAFLGDEFTDEDKAALEMLRRLAAAVPGGQAEDGAQQK